MKESRPHSNGSGIPSSHSIPVSTAATIRPNSVVTHRYRRVPCANVRNATTTWGRSRAAVANRPGKCAASRHMNRRAAMRKTALDRSATRLSKTLVTRPAMLPVSSFPTRSWTDCESAPTASRPWVRSPRRFDISSR
jgi:hypothetical protein